MRGKESSSYRFSQKGSPGGKVQSLTLKNQSFLIKLKLSVLHNINIKNRT